MREEGYGALTARRIATKAGLKHQVIYYYFETLDHLYLEVFRKGSRAGRARMIEALDSPEPLRALWEISSDPSGSRFATEFMALANHNEVIRAEIAQWAVDSRKLQAEAISRHLASRGIEPRISPSLAMFLMSAMARTLINETRLGVDIGHTEARQLIEACLGQYQLTGGAPATSGG